MFSLSELVTTSKTNQDGYLNTVSIANMMQDCSQMWMQSEPSLEEYFFKNNISQLLVFRQIDIIRRPKYGEKLTTTTSVFDFRSFFGYRNTVIYDEKGHPCIVSWSMGAFVDMSINRMTKIPDDIFDTMQIDDKVSMEYLDRKIVIPECETSKMQPIHVLRNDIDMNHHMNNAQYVRIATEFVPSDFCFDRMRIEYKKPAKEGDLIYPSIRKLGNILFVLLLDEKNQPYAIVEFSKALSI